MFLRFLYTSLDLSNIIFGFVSSEKPTLPNNINVIAIKFFFIFLIYLFPKLNHLSHIYNLYIHHFCFFALSVLFYYIVL